MKARECAHWPETRQFKREGETVGPVVPTKPGKVDHSLSTKPHRYMWYQDTMNLYDAKVTEPFDFEPGYKVPEAVWDALLKEAARLQIYVGAVNRIVPLDKPDFQDRDGKGNARSHLALTWNILNGTDLS